MLKNILKLEGAQKLTKNEQKSINGGSRRTCAPSDGCFTEEFDCPNPLNFPICVKKSDLL